MSFFALVLRFFDPFQLFSSLALPEAGLKPVVILDADFASVENLALLRELGYSCFWFINV